jgi:anti-sigma regulatory factor (Ser/Thr protein kinase)
MPGPSSHVAADISRQRPGEVTAADPVTPHQLVIDGWPEQAAVARAFVRRVLGSGHPGTERAILLTSELVTNSINHSKSHGKTRAITVTVLATAGLVRVEVADDGGATVPSVSCGDDLAETGRGLQLVSAYSTSWDYRRSATYTVTWFECLANPLP